MATTKEVWIRELLITFGEDRKPSGAAVMTNVTTTFPDGSTRTDPANQIPLRMFAGAEIQTGLPDDQVGLLQEALKFLDLQSTATLDKLDAENKQTIIDHEKALGVVADDLANSNAANAVLAEKLAAAEKALSAETDKRVEAENLLPPKTSNAD